VTKIKQTFEGKGNSMWCWWECWEMRQLGMNFLILYIWLVCKVSACRCGFCRLFLKVKHFLSLFTITVKKSVTSPSNKAT